MLQNEFDYAAGITACVKYAVPEAVDNLHSRQTGFHFLTLLPHTGHLGICRGCTRWSPRRTAKLGMFASPQRFAGSQSSKDCLFHRTAQCLHKVQAVFRTQVGSKADTTLRCCQMLCCTLLGSDQTNRCVDTLKINSRQLQHNRQDGVAQSLISFETLPTWPCT